MSLLFLRPGTPFLDINIAICNIAICALPNHTKREFAAFSISDNERVLRVRRATGAFCL
jgi:hypothetical protein